MTTNLGTSDGNERSPAASADKEEASSGSEGCDREMSVQAIAAGAPAPASRGNWFRRFFWLDEKLADVSAHHLGPKQSGWQEFELAREARTVLQEAKELGEFNFHVLLLARSEVQLLLRCHLLQNGLTVPTQAMTSEDWDRARKVAVVDAIWVNLTAHQSTAVQACFGLEGENWLIALSTEERTGLIAVLTEMALALMQPLESDASEIGRVLTQRWLRIAIASALAVAGIWSASHRILDKAGTVNLALNRPVTTSSQEPTAGLDHHLLVDGNHATLGFHTLSGPNQFVVIDLGSNKKFDKVVVYNRTECCNERAVPARLEVSDDGVNYTKLEDRKEIFDVWTASMLRASGRYVRLRLLESNYFHLNEVEIY